MFFFPIKQSFPPISFPSLCLFHTLPTSTPQASPPRAYFDTCKMPREHEEHLPPFLPSIFRLPMPSSPALDPRSERHRKQERKKDISHASPCSPRTREENKARKKEKDREREKRMKKKHKNFSTHTFLVLKPPPTHRPAVACCTPLLKEA